MNTNWLFVFLPSLSISSQNCISKTEDFVTIGWEMVKFGAETEDLEHILVLFYEQTLYFE